jgi:protein-disulfide isomerase
MRITNLSFVAVLALASSECARPTFDDDPPKPEIVAAAPKPASDAPSAVRVPIDGLPVFGNSRALVTIVAFVDYDCPFCKRADATLAQLRATYKDDVRIAIASKPLPMHPRAAPAARAFLAAAELGKGEAMHEKLFATLGAHDDDGITNAAIAVGLEPHAFETMRTSAGVSAALAKSDRLAKNVGVTGTPCFFVNGRRISGAQPYDDFATLIDEELTRARHLLDRGVAPEEIYAVIMATAPAAPPAPPEAPAVDPVAVEVAVDGAPVRGDRRAPVSVVVFSDFECPYCVKLEATLKSLEAAHPGKVRVAYRHHPLPMHEHARLASKASIAADRQGRFWQYHDVLITHRDALDRASLERYASEVGLDVARFSRDLDDPKLDERIEADEAQATKLGVKGTPTTFIDGHRIVGAQPVALFESAITTALAKR